MGGIRDDMGYVWSGEAAFCAEGERVSEIGGFSPFFAPAIFVTEFVVPEGNDL